MANENKEFKRVLNTLDVLVVAFGAMIGWGWVVASGQWIQTGGVIGTALAFAIGGLMIYFVGLTYAELTTAMPKCGGEQHFSYTAFGALGSFVCTWALILSYVGVVCFEACSFPTILQYIFPGIQQGYLYTVAGFDVYLSWVLIAVFMALVIMLINIRGTKTAAVFQTVLTVTIAGVGLLLIAASAFTGSVENIQQQAIVGESGSDVMGNILKVAIMTPFFLFGFDVIPQAAEEIKVPLKKLGRLMVLSIGLAVTFYALVVIAIGYVMNSQQLANSMQATGLVTADAMAIAFSSSFMAKVLILGGLCGIITSWNSFLIGGSRVMFSMSNSHMIPGLFSQLHKNYKTPVAALLMLGMLSMLAPLLGRVMLVWIVDAANFACCLAYCMVAVSYIIIRRQQPEMERPYKIKHGILIGLCACVMSGFMVLMYIIPGMNCSLTWEEWIIVGGWTIIGVAFGIWSKWHYKEKFASGMDYTKAKKVATLALFLIVFTGKANAQVPYYGGTVGTHKLFGYHSLKVRPGINNQRTYTTLQYGINDWFSIGTDLTTGPGEKFVGYYARVGEKFNQWISAGIQMTPSFDLDNSHKFSYNTTGVFLNGDITKDGKLFWTSNTWHTANDGAPFTLEQWWYLGGNFKLSKNSSIWPHIGVVHSWKFDQDADLAAGFFYVYKQYSLYLWGNDFFKEHPRATFAIDFTF